MNRNNSKTVHESFARFFELPTRESLRSLLKEHVGELRSCDFKESWPEHAPVARHLLGLANVGGGCLIVGVKENEDKTLAPIGVSQIKDKADIVSGVKLFLPEPLLAALEIADFSYEAAEYATLVGKRFQVVFVHGRPDAVPFVAQRGGSGVRAGAIYIRREGATDEASYEEVQRLLTQRLAAFPQTVEARNLKEHLEELKVLYAEIPKNIQGSAAWIQEITKFASVFSGETKKNPGYPAEDYQAFVHRVLDGKKKLIENLIGLPK
jgi:predicted HTH transcriptional regulator